MSNPYKGYTTDKAAEVDGVWQDYGDFKVKIARIGRSNKAFRNMVEAKTKKYRRQIETNNLDSGVSDRISMECIASTVVLGWKARVDGNWLEGQLVSTIGDLLPATPENINVLFQEIPDLFTAIYQDAENAELFRQGSTELDSGN